VATGAVAMPEKLSAPLAGTIEQAGPKGWATMVALLDGAELVMSGELLPEPEALLLEESSEPQAERVTAVVVAATSSAPRVRRVLFTSVVLLGIDATAAVMATSR
jgi:hypothetical protein